MRKVEDYSPHSGHVVRNNYRGLLYTTAKADGGAVSITVYDPATRTYVFNSGIQRNTAELLKTIQQTAEYYNDILRRCRDEV